MVEVEVSSGDSLLLTCVACDAVWERHGAWTGRVCAPNREKLLAARLHSLSLALLEPSALAQAELVTRPD